MHPTLPRRLTPLPPEYGGWTLAVQAINSVSLAVVTSKLLLTNSGVTFGKLMPVCVCRGGNDPDDR
jgi:hypothetical protein